MKFNLIDLEEGMKAFRFGCSDFKIYSFLDKWRSSIEDFNFLLILASSKTAEVEGISWAGATPESRRYTALADAEMILEGPLAQKQWPLPPLPGGVSPALISYVASSFLGVKPIVIAAGLIHKPTFPHLVFESSSEGPANCLSSGHAMSPERVNKLWDAGLSMGLQMKKPLLITECVPGGTTTAHAVLSAFGLEVSEFISGSVLKPPVELKRGLVNQGLSSACLGLNPLPKDVLAAVGDPFQVISLGLLVGARRAGQPVLLGGGSQMLAVLALALADLDPMLRACFVSEIAIATTSWLVEESHDTDKSKSSFLCLMELLSEYFQVTLQGFSSGLKFACSSKKVLHDYEIGYVKEGVGAGALSFLAQLKGVRHGELIEACEIAVDQLEGIGGA